MRRLRQAALAEGERGQPVLDRRAAARAGVDGQARRLVQHQHRVVAVEQARFRVQSGLPWQCLYFLPEPQGQGALRGVRDQVEGSAGFTPAACRGAGAAPPIAG